MGDSNYKELARLARNQANAASTPSTRKALLEIAERYETLARSDQSGKS
jgi:hypothetical protein